jgi:hypothetical protein
MRFNDLPHTGHMRINLKCPQCGASLVRITEPNVQDWVGCLRDRIGGNYKEIMENGGQFVIDSISPEEAAKLRDYFGFHLREEFE